MSQIESRNHAQAETRDLVGDYLCSHVRPALNPEIRIFESRIPSLIQGVVEIVAKQGAGGRPVQVLDVGGGKGWGTAIGEIPGVDYRILDILPAIDDDRIIQGDICTRNEQLADDSFDIVFSKDTFEHLLEPWAAAEEITRITKPDGIVIVTTPFSWRYHPSPVDTYRFSHTGLCYLFARTRQVAEISSGYSWHGPVRGFWNNRKDWTWDGVAFQECWETVFVGQKSGLLPEFDPQSLDGDFSTDHGGVDPDINRPKTPQAEDTAIQTSGGAQGRTLVRRLKSRVRSLVTPPEEPVTPSSELPPVATKGLIDSGLQTCRLSHIAAFTPPGGNAGDILLPGSLQDSVTIRTGGVEWHPVPVRDAVRPQTIDAVNATQGLIIGGGGLFIPDTNSNQFSGWQWPCPVELLSQIQVPLCVMAVGYNRFRNQPEFSPVFREHLECLARKSVFIGLRNHGSINALKEYLPEELHDRLRYHPCLTAVAGQLYPALFSRSVVRPFLALNCAFDRAELRYGEDQDRILQAVASAVRVISERYSLEVRYYSHYGGDLEMTDHLSSAGVAFTVDDLTSCTPRQIVHAYSRPQVVLGMRGHAQMIPFGCHTPVVSLISHDKLRWFLDDIGQESWGVELHESDVDSRITSAASQILENRSAVVESIRSIQSRLWQACRQNIDDFLDHVATN